jgi:hypothetical protein
MLNNKIMKKLYIYTSLLLLTTMGCKKELNQNPSNAILEQVAFVTPSDFTNAILGAYDGLKSPDPTFVRASPYYYGGQDGGSMATTPDVLSDNLLICSQGRKSEQDYFNYQMSGTDNWDLFPSVYAQILRDNYILTNINNLPAGDFKNNIEGEALALRALAHFDLLRTYAKPYTQAVATDLGVPYVTSIDPKLLPARTPDKQAYDLVVADMVKAVSLIATDNGPYRLNKASAWGLLSRIYLYRGEWQNSVTAADSSITEANNLGHSLGTPGNFSDIWVDADDQSSSEVLFRISFQDADNIAIGVGYEQASPTAGVKPEYVPDFAFFNMYTATDIRKTAYIGQTTFGGINFNYIKKYFGRKVGNANVVDYKVIRLGEVYITRAEAESNLGDDHDALTDLNTLRAGRYTDYAPLSESGTQLYSDILLQRRLELAFEGSRFYDIKRLGIALQRSPYGDYADGTGFPAIVQTIPAGSKLFELPIPQSEINVNHNIVQNPQ